jgi:hypothetical protein
MVMPDSGTVTSAPKLRKLRSVMESIMAGGIPGMIGRQGVPGQLLTGEAALNDALDDRWPEAIAELDPDSRSRAAARDAKDRRHRTPSTSNAPADAASEPPLATSSYRRCAPSMRSSPAPAAAHPVRHAAGSRWRSRATRRTRPGFASPAGRSSSRSPHAWSVPTVSSSTGG